MQGNGESNVVTVAAETQSLNTPQMMKAILSPHVNSGQISLVIVRSCPSTARGTVGSRHTLSTENNLIALGEEGSVQVKEEESKPHSYSYLATSTITNKKGEINIQASVKSITTTYRPKKTLLFII